MSKINFCEVKDLKIAYREEGSGVPILFIHGITTYSFIWRKLFPFLSSEFKLVAVDLVGCGNSDKPLDVDYSIASQAEYIKAFIEKLNLGKVHLVAHDIGGGVAQILAVKYPELFFDVTLINSVAYDFWPVQPIIAMRTPIVRQLAMATLDFGAFRLIVKRGLYNHDILNDELMELFWMPMKTKLGRKAFLHLAEGLNNKQLVQIADDLHSSKLPFLIIRGEADVYLSGNISESLHKNIEGSKLIKIPTAGHFIMEEAAEEISNALVKFYNGELNG